MSATPIFDAIALKRRWRCTVSISKATPGGFDWIRCTRTPWHDGPHENGNLTWTGIYGLSIASGISSAQRPYPYIAETTPEEPTDA